MLVAADVLEDLRPRRAPRRLRGRAAGARRGDGRRCGAPFDVTTPAQAAALASLDDDAEIARRRALNAEGLARLAATLRAHGFEPAPARRELRLRRHRRATRRALFEALLREGVIVRPLRGLRRARRDPRHRRDARGERVLRRGARARPARAPAADRARSALACRRRCGRRSSLDPPLAGRRRRDAP